jgi:DNA-3-methyladenine glycosylase II
VKNTHDVFHDLMSCVLEQQIHYRSTKKIFQKMLDSAGLERVSPENFDFFAQKAFGQAKLSIQKLETIEAVLDFWRHYMIDWPTLSDTEVRTQISTIKGIGPWTMDMILMYTLQRPNIFPYDDITSKRL